MKHASLLLLGLVLAATSCTPYASFREIRPIHQSPTPAGQVITRTLELPLAPPLVQIGGYLDAASKAEDVLAKQPDDTQARLDYNFAVARIFGVIEAAGLQPWKSPIECPGASRVWTLSIKRDPRPERNPSHFRIRPADIYQFQGTLVVQRTVKEGIGAPLVVMSRDIAPEKIDPFAQGKRIFYGMTGMVELKAGGVCVASFIDPLAEEDVRFAGRTYPLAADFTAPLAMALAYQQPRRKEIDGLFNPREFESKTRLARLQPYDPKKIPVLCIHGLGDSQATWAPLIQTLRMDPVIRKKYQFWFFSYPTGYPYPLTAAVLRRKLDSINAFYPDHKKIVVVGHSMGGMIARTLITDSGMSLWNAIYPKPPAEMAFSPETRAIMTETLIFNHRPEISRVIFASASHRGSDIATSFLGRLGSRIIGAPGDMLPPDTKALALAKPNSTGANLNQLPNSIDFLKPTNRFVTTLDKIPVVKGVPYHSIIGDRGLGGNLDRQRPVSTDGIVPYWSSHFDGAQSELIIPSRHWTNQHPLGIAEVGRILHEHVKNR